MVLKLFEMFAGYGGGSFALKRIGIPFECVGYSEIDKYAIQCYEQNHEGTNYGDCTKINPNDLPNFDLLTAGFPCQSFSVAGKGKGELDSRGTLFYDIIRIAEVKQPKYILLENVKGLTYQTHKKTFDKILELLDKIGYTVYWKILNSKDYGLPQNRERVFFVCFRKDIEPRLFEWPEEEELKLRLIDVLEEEVDPSYFLSEKALKRLFKNERSIKERFCDKVYSPTLCARDYKDPKAIRVDIQEGRDREIKRVYHPEGISPTLHKKTGGWQEVKILKGQDVRNLTPTEYFRLMGFLNDEIKLENISKCQKYNLAGNGWDVNLVSKIFKKMLKSEEIE